MAFESALTKAAMRATPLSEMARWKRFLARGDNTWEESGEEERLGSRGGGLRELPHLGPGPSPGDLGSADSTGPRLAWPIPQTDLGPSFSKGKAEDTEWGTEQRVCGKH